MNEPGFRASWGRAGAFGGILAPIRLPRMAAIRQRFVDDAIRDIPARVTRELARPEIGASIRPGMSVAITAGSRGIANIVEILREVVSAVKARGGRPFIFPAMGSHGGATREGQQQLLEGYGITERAIGAPVRATMDTIVVGATAEGHPVHLDRHAAEADGIIVIGRIKPHTAFHGSHESGLVKMIAVGMGKQKGAEICHAQGFGSFARVLPSFARVVLSTGKVLFGLGIVENSREDTFLIEAIAPAAIEGREPELLEQARRLMPSIPFAEFDVLVVDEIGKNFSGDGADPNITGTYATAYASGGPRIKRYVVLDVHPESRGNSVGVGMADVTTTRLLEKTDFDAMYLNALTSRALNIVRMPLVMANDRLALQAALYSSIGADLEHPRIVRISNTSHIETMSISEALLGEAGRNPAIEIVQPPRELVFDPEGNLVDRAGR
jgi:hypothetical protein